MGREASSVGLLNNKLARTAEQDDGFWYVYNRILKELKVGVACIMSCSLISMNFYFARDKKMISCSLPFYL